MSDDPKIRQYKVDRSMDLTSGSEQVNIVLDASVPRSTKKDNQAARALLAELSGGNSGVSSPGRKLERQVFAAVAIVFISSYLRRWANQG